jgi:PucR C-terminal helix-turn-helix domain/GGDEF-like domain
LREVSPATDPRHARTELLADLRQRRPEIEESIRVRVYAIADPSEAADPEYADGLRAAVGAALEYGFAGIEAEAERIPPVPPTLLAQARIAARNAVSLDTVLRRYVGGYALLGDYLIEAAGAEGVGGSALKRLLRTQAALFDRLTAAVSEEYGREEQGLPDSIERRRAERVQRLLDGELLDTSELGYALDAHHLGAIAAGPGAGPALRALAAALDRRLLLVHPGERSVWAWLGGRRGIDREQLERVLARDWPAKVSLALGAPGQGLAAWRLTHRQAQAALPIAVRSPEAYVHYADVALLASALCDEVLSASLEDVYLAPLAEERDGGAALRETLLAYFAAGRHASAAAASLGISRQTVNSRLRVAEERVGRSVDSCAAEIETALRLERLSTRQPL